jgi:hypothetical protein
MARTIIQRRAKREAEGIRRFPVSAAWPWRDTPILIAQTTPKLLTVM